MVEKACRRCRMIVGGDVCPVCKDSELTKSFEGYILVVSTEGSEVAKQIGATIPGRYALKIK